MRKYNKNLNPIMAKTYNARGDLPKETGHNQRIAFSSDEDDKGENTKILPAHDVPHKHKNRLYKSPDHVFVVKEDMVVIFQNKLKSLVARGGCYYEIFDRGDEPKTFLLVLFFEDAIFDV
jgi:hypothetical protein